MKYWNCQVTSYRYSLFGAWQAPPHCTPPKRRSGSDRQPTAAVDVQAKSVPPKIASNGWRGCGRSSSPPAPQHDFPKRRGRRETDQEREPLLLQLHERSAACWRTGARGAERLESGPSRTVSGDTVLKLDASAGSVVPFLVHRSATSGRRPGASDSVRSGWLRRYVRELRCGVARPPSGSLRDPGREQSKSGPAPRILPGSRSSAQVAPQLRRRRAGPRHCVVLRRLAAREVLHIHKIR